MKTTLLKEKLVRMRVIKKLSSKENVIAIAKEMTAIIILEVATFSLFTITYSSIGNVNIDWSSLEKKIPIYVEHIEVRWTFFPINERREGERKVAFMHSKRAIHL